MHLACLREGDRTSLRHNAIPQEMRDDVMDDSGVLHNKRLHAYLGYVGPNNFEKLARAT
jgi:hypothetical protein